METGELSALLTAENAAFVQKARTEGPPKKFSDDLKREMDAFLVFETRDIPPKPKTETVYHEGTAGILPSPAKKIVAKDVMAGQSATPLKVVREEEPTGKKERQIDRLSFYVVTDVNPPRASSRSEIEGTIALLRSIEEYMRLETVLPTKGWDEVSIKKQRMVINILRSNTVGTYDVQQFEALSPADIEEAISRYEKSVKESLTFSPTERPSSRDVADENFRTRIGQDVEKDKQEKGNSVRLPVFVYPHSEDYVESMIDFGRPFLIADGKGIRLMVKEKDKWGFSNLVTLTSKNDN